MFKIIYLDNAGFRKVVYIEADDSVQAVLRFDFEFDHKYSWITNVKEQFKITNDV